MNQKPARKITTPLSLKWFGWTDKGRIRLNNEDSFLGLQFDAREIHRLGKFGKASTEKWHFAFAVSDGIGGALAGEFASRIAVEKITALLPPAFQPSVPKLKAGFADVLARLFSQIHGALVYVGNSYEECVGMETTLSLCWFTPNWMCFGHIGDSRIYHLPAGKNKIKQLSEDDTHVGWLLRNGQINEREARTHPRRNVLQKALGGGNQFVGPQVGAVAYKTGDIFLLCTDGLVEGLNDNQIAHLLLEFKPVKTNLAQFLVKMSLKNDGRDNTTALIIQVV